MNRSPADPTGRAARAAQAHAWTAAAWLATAVAAASAAPSAHAGGYCFTIVAPDGRVVQQTTEAPVDLARPLSAGLAAAGFARGTHLAFDQRADDCPRIAAAAPRATARAPATRDAARRRR